MLKLFGKKYIDYEDVLSFVNDEIEFYRVMWRYYRDLSTCSDLSEDQKELYWKKGTEYLHKCSTLIDFKNRLNEKFGKA